MLWDIFVLAKERASSPVLKQIAGLLSTLEM